VFGIFEVAVALVTAGMSGNQLVVVIEAKPIGKELEGEPRASVKGGNRVSVSVKHNATTAGGAHGAHDACVGGQGRQRFEMGSFFGKKIDRPFLCLGMDTGVGDLIHPVAHGGVKRGQRAWKFQAGQEVPFDVADGIFHAAFFVGFAHVAGAGLKAVVSGELQVARMEEGLFAQRVREHTGFQVVDHHGAGSGAKELERVLLAAQKVFERLAEGELHVEHAAVAEQHDEKGEPPAGERRRSADRPSGKSERDKDAG
jgi:hypothetical protein